MKSVSHVKNWIAIASADHVAIGQREGIMQVCHGKRAPLHRLRPGDRVVYYSPSVKYGAKDKLQAFTSIGVVADGAPYQVDMGNGFHPYRRDVNWCESVQAPIQPLLDQLDLTMGRSNWGYQFRFGLTEITSSDMCRIAREMKAAAILGSL